MIEFVLDESQNDDTLYFEDVDTNQFFITCGGYLAMKRTPDSYVSIADEKGLPYCDFYDGISDRTPIKKILPKVARINF